MIYLAILCAITAAAGYFLPDIPLTITAYIDAAIKLALEYLLFSSRSQQQNNSLESVVQCP